MTFKDLKKRVTLEEPYQQSRLFEKLQNKPFWIWDKQQHKLEDIKTDGDCCFNHVLSESLFRLLLVKETYIIAVLQVHKAYIRSLVTKDQMQLEPRHMTGFPGDN